MRFNINKSELLNALTIASKGTASRSTIPVLSGVYIKAEGMGLVMETTDLERSIRYSVPALVEEEGTTVIPEKLLLDIVKNLPEAAVEFQTNDSTVTVSCGKSSFTLKTLDAADFPPFPNVDVSSSIEVPFAEFCSMVKRVAKVVSKDQSRAVLTGVLISTSDEGLRMVATDSYRLAVADIALEGVQGNFEAIVSGVFLQEVAGLPKMEENITIGLTANQIVFTYQNMVLINRRIEGNFPNYRQIIPQSWATKTCFTTQELITAVKRVGLVSALSSPVKIDINAEAGNAIINAATQDVGSAEEVVGCEVAGKHSNRLESPVCARRPYVCLDRPGVLRDLVAHEARHFPCGRRRELPVSRYARSRILRMCLPWQTIFAFRKCAWLVFAIIEASHWAI